MADDGRPVIAVLGAIGPDKGARRLERLVELTRERGLPLRWVLIGYLDRGREPLQSADGVFTMHGAYDSRALRELIEHYRVRLVAYPSAGPETFSFTLSEAWAAGRPAIVPPIGALADRVAETGAGWVLGDDEWNSEARMLDRIVAVLDSSHAEEFAEAARRANSAVQLTLDAMTDATIAIYRVLPPAREAAPRCDRSARRAALPHCATRRGARRRLPPHRQRPRGATAPLQMPRVIRWRTWRA
jgi:glycosyltransferase involved in cell wall biosynthesis